MSLLEVSGVKKTYKARRGGASVEALKNVNFTVEKGEYVAIMGESGSGKTTLLNILAALDKATAGTVILDGMNLTTIKDAAIAKFRRDNLGYVFQDFNLLDTFTLEDNIYLPLVLAGKRHSEMKERLDKLAPSLGITDLLKKYPYEVSGGQKQRAAIARALITNPKIVLALMVTHSTKAASHASRVMFIKDGIIFHQIYKGNSTDTQMYQKISDTLNLLAQGGDLK